MAGTDIDLDVLSEDQKRRCMAILLVKHMWPTISHEDCVLVAKWLLSGRLR